MNKQIQINVPEWFVQDELHIIAQVISPNADNVGILLAGENFDLSKQCSPTVRMYLLHLIDEQYEFIKELDAFQFNSSQEAEYFTSKLPEMNAIDLVMMLNKQEPVFSM